MNYKLIPQKYRFYVPENVKSHLIRNIEIEKNNNIAPNETEPLSVICRTNAKVYIHLHNGDLRNSIKYFYKLQVLYSDFILELSEKVEKNEMLEGEFVNLCDFFKANIDGLRLGISTAYSQYLKKM